jgi:hypothetical protein
MRAFAEICGAAAVLVAFVAAQIGIIAPRTRSYLCLNLFGSVVLAVIALSLRQWGFLALEAAWALVSAFTLARTLSRRFAHLSLPRRFSQHKRFKSRRLASSIRRHSVQSTGAGHVPERVQNITKVNSVGPRVALKESNNKPQGGDRYEHIE